MVSSPQPIFFCHQQLYKIPSFNLYRVREPVALKAILGFASQVGSLAFGQPVSLEHAPRAWKFQGGLLVKVQKIPEKTPNLINLDSDTFTSLDISFQVDV